MVRASLANGIDGPRFNFPTLKFPRRSKKQLSSLVGHTLLLAHKCYKCCLIAMTTPNTHLAKGCAAQLSMAQILTPQAIIKGTVAVKMSP